MNLSVPQKLRGRSGALRAGEVRADHMVRIIEQHQQEPLTDFFRRLVAENDSVPVSRVTLEYIEAQRRAEIYPDLTYEEHSSYGGYCSDGLAPLTRSEADRLIAASEKKID